MKRSLQHLIGRTQLQITAFLTALKFFFRNIKQNPKSLYLHAEPTTSDYAYIYIYIYIKEESQMTILNFNMNINLYI